MVSRSDISEADIESIELTFEVRERVAVLALREGQKRFSLSLLKQLHALVQELRQRRDIGALWLRSESDDFSEGMNLLDPDLASVVLGGEGSRRQLAQLGQSLIESWMSLAFPTVVSCRGNILGAGAGLMIASSFRFATPDARCGFPEVGFGMTLSWGILPRLVREMGPSWARRLVLAGEVVSMSEFDAGFSRMVPPDDLDHASFELAQCLAKKPPRAMRHTLEALHSLERDHQLLARDDELRFALTAGSDEFVEAVGRFLGEDT